MKTTFKNLLLAAAGLLIFTGCAKDDTTQELPTQRYELSFSGAKPELQSDTRTVFDNGSVLWSPSGERIRMAYTLDGAWVIKKLYASNDAEVSSDGTTASFTVSADFTDTTPGTYQFYALYPSGIHSGTDFPNAPAVSVNIPATQSPSATSFDPQADVMLGKAVQTYTALPTEAVSVSYTRMVAHGAVTLTGLAFETDETIKSITFTAPTGMALAGNTVYDIVEQTQTNSSPAVNAITLNYADATLAAGAFTGWFCSVPFTVASGDPFTIEVTSSRGTYTHTIYARAAGIVFRQNTYNTLSVNMATAEFEATEDLGLAGDYVVLALQGSTYYALSSIATTTRLTAPAFTYDGTSATVETDDDTIVWTIADAGSGNYTIASSGKYLTTRASGAETSTTPSSYTITSQENGSYRINSATASSNGLRYNSYSKWFGFYTSNPSTSMIADMVLVPVSIVATPKVTVAETTLGLTADDTAVNSVGVEFTNATAADLTIDIYESTEGTTEATWLTAEYNNGNIDILAEANTGDARTARVVLTVTTALGTNSATITVSQGAAGATVTGIIYQENFGNPSSSTAVSNTYAWERGGLLNQSGVSYAYTGITSTPLRTSTPSTGYAGASGQGCLYTAAEGQLTVSDINVASTSKLAFSLGSQATSANLTITYQFDTQASATTMTATAAKTGVNWGLVSYNAITVPTGATTMTISITIGSAHRIDDLKLTTSE